MRDVIDYVTEEEVVVLVVVVVEANLMAEEEEAGLESATGRPVEGGAAHAIQGLDVVLERRPQQDLRGFRVSVGAGQVQRRHGRAGVADANGVFDQRRPARLARAQRVALEARAAQQLLQLAGVASDGQVQQGTGGDGGRRREAVRGRLERLQVADGRLDRRQVVGLFAETIGPRVEALHELQLAVPVGHPRPADQVGEQRQQSVGVQRARRVGAGHQRRHRFFQGDQLGVGRPFRRDRVEDPQRVRRALCGQLVGRSDHIDACRVGADLVQLAVLLAAKMIPSFH